MKYPNFLIIGAGKSGTTSIYNLLKQHPEVYMTPAKEPDYFFLMDQKKVDPKDDPEQFHYYPEGVYTLEDYQALFAGMENEKAAGEASTCYLYKPNVHLNIKKLVPDVKMIAIFRQPVDRLYSRWLHLAREDNLPSDKFEDAFDQNSIWWKRDDLVPEGFYYKHLSKYFEIFDRKQFAIYLMKDMRTDPKAFYKSLYSFLEIDDTFEPVTDVQYNVSGFVKNKFKDKLYGQNSVIRKTIEKVSPTLVDKMRNSIAMQKVVTNLRKGNLDRPKLDPATRKRMIDEIYKDDILKLQDLIDRDLTSWLE
jgi:hypothetical protein